MEKYRKQLKNSIIALMVFNCVILLLGIMLRSFIPNSERGLGIGFLSGLLVGIPAACIVFIACGVFILKDEAALKKAYIAYTDERNNAIRLKSSNLGFVICIACIAIALVVSSVLDRTVALTLLCVLLFTMAVSIITNIIYRKKL
ncbi:MAG: hypothetical protein IKZ82_14170 [Clostridia bacterium]|nr:hypothetical protein [Clostridia bacterium]